MDSLKIAVFAYNFPHRKTQDFLYRLYTENLNTALVIAADPVHLNIPSASVRTKLRHTALVHPQQICERMGIPYVVMPHNSKKLPELVAEYSVELGLIAGARILKDHIIKSFPLGIINFHPGLIPQTRGLDAMMWSVHNDIPQAVTAHLIDARVDAGTILFVDEMPIWADDTPFDFQERLYEMQIDMIPRAVDFATRRAGTEIGENTHHNTKMPPETEAKVLEMFPEYVTRRANR
jgi:phosphoribosylglycinamide formyltransferase-1